MRGGSAQIGVSEGGSAQIGVSEARGPGGGGSVLK